MAWTNAARIVFNTALLTKLQTGSGTAAIKVYSSTNVNLHAYAINTATSSVNATTGELTLVESSPSTSLANGIGSYAQLVGEDATILEDAIPLVEGTSVVAGSLVVSSLTYVLGNNSALVSASVM